MASGGRQAHLVGISFSKEKEIPTMEPPAKKLKTVDTNADLQSKNKKLSLSLKKKKQLSPESRYHKVQKLELSELEKGCTPANTKKCTEWAVNNFETWRKHKNSTQKNNVLRTS